MNDRELLEKAAKAAGYELSWGITDPMIRCLEAGHPDKTHNLWNPLTDDGDALRLAVKLRLEMSWWKDAVSVETDDRKASSGICKLGDDPAAATRRAIVRAAAQMAAVDS